MHAKSSFFEYIFTDHLDSLRMHLYTCRDSMSYEQLKAFVAKVKQDKTLQDQVKKENADLVSIAKAAGFSITTDDLRIAYTEWVKDSLAS